MIGFLALASGKLESGISPKKENVLSSLPEEKKKQMIFRIEEN